jgi:hypothetical protein
VAFELSRESVPRGVEQSRELAGSAVRVSRDTELDEECEAVEVCAFAEQVRAVELEDCHERHVDPAHCQPLLINARRSSLHLVKAMLDGTMPVVLRPRFGLPMCGTWPIYTSVRRPNSCEADGKSETRWLCWSKLEELGDQMPAWQREA